MSGASTSKAHNGPRSVTLLGATGSIGGSTIDLLLHARDRYRVEAVVASRNAGALAALARKIGARFAAIADHGPIGGGPLSRLQDTMIFGAYTGCFRTMAVVTAVIVVTIANAVVTSFQLV